MREPIALVCALHLGTLVATAVARAQDAAPQPEAPQPVVVPPELTRFEEARLPPDLAVSPGRYVVTLVLTIDEAGKVSEVAVKASDQPALDALAVAAARAFEFRPATVDGKPAAVAVTYRYVFDVRPRERAVVHVFRVREKGTRDPVDGVTGIVEENGKTFTAREGRIEIAELPPGSWTFYVPEEEFLEERAAFEVKEGKPGASDLWLERRTGAARQTVIRAPKEARYVARQTLEASELRRLPGSGGDPLKMIENLPGVGRAAFGGGSTVIYGSHFLDSQVLLDSLPMWWFFHFGGLYSTIHPDFIDRIDYIPAGFDASYGFATGGIVDVKLKDAPLTGWHGSADVNSVHAGGMIGFPYSKNGDLQVAFRRSYIDALVAAVWPSGDSTLATAPRYYDYQVRWQHRFGRRHRVSIFVNGSDDALEVVNKHPDMDDPMFVGSLGLTTWIHGAQLRWDAEPTPAIRNSLAVKGLAVGFGFDLFQAIKMDVVQAPVHVRDQLSWRISDRLRLHAGMDGILSYSRFDVTAPQVPGPGSGDMAVSTLEIIRSRDTIRVYAAAPFLSLEWDAFPWWTIVPSVRGTVVFGDWVDGWFEPRLSNRFPIGHGVTLKLAGGLYGQTPPPYTFTKEFGGQHVGPEYATHALLGAEWNPIERVTVTADLFFKWMFHLAEPSKDRTERYTNEGKGRAYGGDVMVRVNPGGPLFGWLAYTYVVAERWDPERELWRPGDFDTRHTLNVVASYELPRHWTVGARFRLASGYPYTPIASSVLDSDADRYAPIPSALRNSARLPLFHQLDVRIDKEWVFRSWKLGAYLEVQNVYYNSDAEGVAYNYDYSKSAYVRGLPILPVFGIKGEF